MCSRLTAKSKSSGNSHTHALTHACTHTLTSEHSNTHTHALGNSHHTTPVHTPSDGMPRRSQARAHAQDLLPGVHANHDDDLPVPTGGVGRGRSGVRVRTHKHTHTRVREIARARVVDIVSWAARLRVYGRPVTRPPIGRRFRAPPDGTRRVRPIARRVTCRTDGMII